MPSHRLIWERLPRGGEYLLEWDVTTLSVKAPDGEMVLEGPVDRAHWIFDLNELDTDGKLTFLIDGSAIAFKRNKQAAKDVRELVLNGLRADAPFRELQKRRAKIALRLGSLLLVVGGGLFTLYCWWASWAEEPPTDHWLHSVGWLIRVVLIVLGGAALGGLHTMYVAFKQLRRVHQVERALAERSSS